MLDDRTLKHRVLLRLLGSPVTLAPFLVGMTILTASWALDWQRGIGWFAGLAGALVSLGALITRLLLHGDVVAGKVLADSVRAEEVARQRALDQLDRDLTTADQDPRPETALRDLRALVRAFEESATGAGQFPAASVVDIHARVSQLFDHCVDSLRQTDRLWKTAQRLHTAPARQPILDQRERTLSEVQATIQQLSGTLVALQSLGTGDGTSAELGRLRDELDQSLAVAKTVEARVNHLVKEASALTIEQPSQPQT